MYMDLCGPMPASLGGARYFMLIKDRRSSYRHVYFLKSKDLAFDKFKEFCESVYAKLRREIIRLRVDNGREFVNNKFQAYLSSKGIDLATSAPYSPHQNGRIERENRTVVEAARTMLLDKNLPQSLWAEAVNTAVYTLNRTLLTTKDSRATPFQLWFGQKPDISHMRPFGISAFVHVPEIMRHKFDAKAIKTYLVGYDEECQNYRLFDQAKAKVIVACDVKFNDLEDVRTDIVIKLGVKSDETHEDTEEDHQRRDEPNNESQDESMDESESESMEVDSDMTVDETTDAARQPMMTVPEGEHASNVGRKKRKLEDTSICCRN